MANDHRPDVGSTISMQKLSLNILLAHLIEAGYQPVGPRIENDTLVYKTLDNLEQLPRGYITEQDAGHFRLKNMGHKRYFDFIPGAHSWKQYLFPSRLDLFAMRKGSKSWEILEAKQDTPKYAFIGVRACELNAIKIQDKAFMREDFTDPVYRARREKVFILAVNCLHPAGTCFCVSMGSGPRVKDGFDICLTELEDDFLLTIGSELARDLLVDIDYESPTAFRLSQAEHGLEQSALSMGRTLETNDLPEIILDNLDHEQWQDVAARCLGCTNCTQVCPTCFCWDTVDQMNLSGTETHRERVWDSCFNPGYSYQVGGNTRPTIRSRYRQWLSHKLGTWKQQYGMFGCVGCGRCITWCPAEIDLTREIPMLRTKAEL